MYGEGVRGYCFEEDIRTIFGSEVGIIVETRGRCKCKGRNQVMQEIIVQEGRRERRAQGWRRPMYWTLKGQVSEGKPVLFFSIRVVDLNGATPGLRGIHLSSRGFQKSLTIPYGRLST